MIDYHVISTGSEGNAVIVNKSILIDCGVSFRALAPYVNDLKLVLLTHIHGDHFRPTTLKRLSEERPLLRFGAGRWLTGPLLIAGIMSRQIDVLQFDCVYDYGPCSVIMFPLSHDVPNCGYKIHFPAGKMIYATDTNSMNGIEARNYDLYMVEANYGSEEIRKRIQDKLAAGEYVYEFRVMKTHMSQEACNDWVYENAGPRSEILYLHGHKEEHKENDDREAEGSEG